MSNQNCDRKLAQTGRVVARYRRREGECSVDWKVFQAVGMGPRCTGVKIGSFNWAAGEVRKLRSI